MGLNLSTLLAPEGITVNVVSLSPVHQFNACINSSNTVQGLACHDWGDWDDTGTQIKV